LMLSRKDIVEDGDWVVLYMGFGNIKSVQMKRGNRFQNHNTSYHHNDIIGKPYGSRVSLTLLSAVAG